MPGPHNKRLLRSSTKLVGELRDDKVDLLFGAAPRITVAPFQKDNEIVSPAFNTLDFFRSELLPLMIDFVSELLPFRSQHIVLHRVTFN